MSGQNLLVGKGSNEYPPHYSDGRDTGQYKGRLLFYLFFNCHGSSSERNYYLMEHATGNPTIGYYLIHWIVSAVALLITAKIIPGFRLSGFWAAMIAAVVIGIANTVIWPILMFLSLPINVLTLGLFTFVVNGAVLKICAGILKGFEITSWWGAIFGAIILSIISYLMHTFVG